MSEISLRKTGLELRLHVISARLLQRRCSSCDATLVPAMPASRSQDHSHRVTHDSRLREASAPPRPPDICAHKPFCKPILEDIKCKAGKNLSASDSLPSRGVDLSAPVRHHTPGGDSTSTSSFILLPPSQVYDRHLSTSEVPPAGPLTPKQRCAIWRQSPMKSQALIGPKLVDVLSLAFRDCSSRRCLLVGA